MKKELFISNEIQDIITAMIQPIAINSVVENLGVSTITTDTIRLFENKCITFDLKDEMIVKIGSKNYQVSNVTHTPQADTFDVVGTGITDNEWCIAINYKTGSQYEINQILNQESGNLNRFPLMWLLPSNNLDFNNQTIDFEADVNLIFAHKANKTDRTTTRIEENLEPIIQPLITLFNLWLQSTNFNYMFEFNGDGKAIDYKKTPYPFYGTSDRRKEVLNVTTDAIECNYNLLFKKQYEY